MALAGSILIVGSARSTGGTMPCDRCYAEVHRLWTIRCAWCIDHEHSICANCLSAAQKAACADPEAQLAHYRQLIEHVRDRRARATKPTAVAPTYRNQTTKGTP